MHKILARRNYTAATCPAWLRSCWVLLAMFDILSLSISGVYASPSHKVIGDVKGSLLMSISADREVALPGATIYLQDARSSARSIGVTTDLDGRFSIPHRSRGSYRLCWQARGLKPGCQTRAIDLGDGLSFLPPVVVDPPSTGFLAGTATLDDGQACNHFDPFFELNVATTVTLVNNTGLETIAKTTANASGAFLILDVPDGKFTIRAACEGAVMDVAIDTTSVHVVDVRLPSRNPIISDIIVSSVGQSIRGSAPSVDVTAQVTGSDGSSLHYKWISGTAGFESVDSPKIRWMLPESSGLHRLYLLVSNGRGGYDISYREISTSTRPARAGSRQITAVDLDSFSGSEKMAKNARLQSAVSFSRYPSDPHQFLLKKGVDDASTTTYYYNAIDPRHLKRTFSKWKLANGFRVNPDSNHNGNRWDDDADTGEISALYQNRIDLGFWRDMHIKVNRNPRRVAAYICNFREAGDALANRNLLACVTMEYSAVLVIKGQLSPTKFTQFYAFNAAGKRIASADLDGRGEKYFPSLCMACHGGQHISHLGAPPNIPNFFHEGDSPDIGAQFLPFDLDNFKFTPAFSRAAQENKFRGLNQAVSLTSPTPAITQLIDGWYTGGSTVQQAFLPLGWSDLDPSHEAAYHEVVKPFCRGCHVTIPGPLAGSNGLNFTSYSQISELSSLLKADICKSRIMPNALLTYKRFWHADASSILSAAGLNDGNDEWKSTDPCPCGGPNEDQCVKNGAAACPSLNPTISFSADIQPIFNSNCTSCHAGAHPRGFLDLSSGNAYDNIVEHDSLKPGGKLVKKCSSTDSILFQRVNGGDMPPGTRLDSTLVDKIRKWIDEGGQEN